MKKIQKSVPKGLLIILFAAVLLFAGGCAGAQQDTNQKNADTKSIPQASKEESGDENVSAFSAEKEENRNQEELSVQFLDVGQGSSALIRQGDHAMLVDGGDRDYSSYVVSFLKKAGVTKLDYVVASHFDADHLNGVVGVLNAVECGQVLAPDYETDTRVYESFLKVVKEKNIPLTSPGVGDEYAFADSSFRVVSPVSYGYADANSNSVGIRLAYGKNSFLLCGDCTEESEQDILYSGVDVESDVFAANHHGSKHSNCSEFLEAVNPKAVVVSCGRDNKYGHPDASVLQKIQTLGSDLYRTDLQGTITAVSDGTDIRFDQEVCMDYRCGTEIKEGAEPQDKADASETADVKDQAEASDTAGVKDQAEASDTAGVKEQAEASETAGVKEQAEPSDAVDTAGAQSQAGDADAVDTAGTQDPAGNADTAGHDYVLNKNTKKFHLPSCSSVKEIKEENKETVNSTKEAVEADGYSPCKRCNP